VEATRIVVGVDGTGLTLAHEGGQPRWVAVSDAAMELLEQIQHDFGEGPCLAAFAEDQVVAVEDLRSERVWDRLAAVVGHLQVRGVLSMPVRLADLAQEVVQEAQREGIAALAVDDARVRAAEARAREAEQALQAVHSGLARRTAALDRAQDDLDERERAAVQRNHLASERERAADDRNHLLDERERAADQRNHLADERERAAEQRDRTAPDSE
jgi:hypothetical protein